MYLVVILWIYFFLFVPTAGVFLWGVDGRPELIPLYWYLAFFSDGFKIYEITENKLRYLEI